MGNISALRQQIGPAHQFFNPGNAKRGHSLAQPLCNHHEEIHDVIGIAGEFLAQFRFSRGDAHRTDIAVALAQHHAAFDHQRRRRHAKFLSEVAHGPEAARMAFKNFAPKFGQTDAFNSGGSSLEMRTNE